MSAREPAPASGNSGFVIILSATLIGGVAGYVVTWVVPRSIGFAEYAAFAIFWSSLFLLGGAVAGIQGEVARGTRSVDIPSPEPRRARNFAIAGAIAVFVVAIASAPLWTAPVFGVARFDLAVPLAVGAASFVLTAVASGVFLGIGRWHALAALVITESLLRLCAIVVTLQFTQDLVVLAWVVALPVPVALLLIWPFVARSVSRRNTMDVTYRQLVHNVVRTLLAAAAGSLIVSGLPLILGIAAAGESKAVLGMVILAVTFTRAPLIISALSLQNFFLVQFRNDPGGFRKRLFAILGVLAGAGVLLAVAGLALGPSVFALLFPNEPVPPAGFIAALVGSSALVGSMFVTAPALLARSEHGAYVLGWLVAAIVTVLAMFVPLDLVAKTTLALILGPVAGLAVHGVRLATTRPFPLPLA